MVFSRTEQQQCFSPQAMRRLDIFGYHKALQTERARLEQAARHEKHWRRWGPYLSERAWGTVREDYSSNGEAWGYFPHDHARSRVYRWSEDGIAGICDNHQRLCFALAFWNGRDPFLKERLFGLSGNEGNHGEDVKEYYHYLDSTPTHSYMKCLYKYPQAEFPYRTLLEENHRRSKLQPEFELIDSGIFDDNRYFDIFTEYAKNDFNDILIRITVVNRGPETAPFHLLPTVWFRNMWSWGYTDDDSIPPRINMTSGNEIEIWHKTLGSYRLWLEGQPTFLFTENETNTRRFWNRHTAGQHYKDAFHEYIVNGHEQAVNEQRAGTKACAWYRVDLAAGETRLFRFRLNEAGSDQTQPPAAKNQLAAQDFDAVFSQRIAEADEFYSFTPATLSDDARAVQRQAFAGLLWSKQFYHFVVESWLHGDAGQPPPPHERKSGRNHEWIHLYNEDVLSMPDKWEYPWFAAWDLAFHMIPYSLIDPDNAKSQLSLFLREWYMHPNGQLPAYEWAFGDVNPPVHAWASWRVFKIDEKLQGTPDHEFLERVFHKLLMNFTWWVNREDSEGNNIFEGGFLGLDNIGVFDRSKPLPTGGFIEQSDGTSWMAMYCLNMLKIALELATKNITYEDIASKFFEHFIHIAGAMNRIGGQGLWDEQDGFYYDRLKLPNQESDAIRVRSMVGLIPLFAVDSLEPEVMDRLPGFKKRMNWFVEHRPDLCDCMASMTIAGREERRLLSIVGKKKLQRILRSMLDEEEFLSPNGLRSISRYHRDHPFVLQADGTEHRVDYEPAESATGLFGGNSNWRGPVWFPLNYLVIESLQKFHHYFGDHFQIEFPSRSGNMLHLGEVAAELSRRLSGIFLRRDDGTRPVFGMIQKFQRDPNFNDYIPFYEYFHGDNGAGLGASHQTGWTSLVAKLLQQTGE